MLPSIDQVITWIILIIIYEAADVVIFGLVVPNFDMGNGYCNHLKFFCMKKVSLIQPCVRIIKINVIPMGNFMAA